MGSRIKRPISEFSGLVRYFLDLSVLLRGGVRATLLGCMPRGRGDGLHYCEGFLRGRALRVDSWVWVGVDRHCQYMQGGRGNVAGIDR